MTARRDSVVGHKLAPAAARSRGRANTRVTSRQIRQVPWANTGRKQCIRLQVDGLIRVRCGPHVSDQRRRKPSAGGFRMPHQTDGDFRTEFGRSDRELKEILAPCRETSVFRQSARSVKTAPRRR